MSTQIKQRNKNNTNTAKKGEEPSHPHGHQTYAKKKRTLRTTNILQPQFGKHRRSFSSYFKK